MTPLKRRAELTDYSLEEFITTKGTKVHKAGILSIFVDYYKDSRVRLSSSEFGLNYFSMSRTFSVPSISFNFTSMTSFMVVCTVRPTKAASIGNSR
jgi:hypothetical protein